FLTDCIRHLPDSPLGNGSKIGWLSRRRISLKTRCCIYVAISTILTLACWKRESVGSGALFFDDHAHIHIPNLPNNPFGSVILLDGNVVDRKDSTSLIVELSSFLTKFL